VTRWLPLLLLLGCPQPTGDGLLAEARRALAERDRRLTSFQLVVDTTEGDARAHHEFLFRSPNKSRGRLTAPRDLELAFDGTQLVTLSHAERRYEVVPLDLPPAERALALASAFLPFAPEGYRAPLLPVAGVEAKAVTRPGAPAAVELTVRPGDGVAVTYVLRLPAADFLEKRTSAEGRERVLRVEAEQCDAALALCVPTRLVERTGGRVLGTTEVTRAVLNPALPAELFAPKKPDGWP
jgi:hypothetical protein